MKYKSLYSPGKKINATKFITELVCKKRAENLKTTLPIKFWELKEWKNFFIIQMKYAYKLLEKYSEETIIDTIQKKNIWSLQAKWVEDEILKAEQKKNKVRCTHKKLKKLKENSERVRVNKNNKIYNKIYNKRRFKNKKTLTDIYDQNQG
jgi:hypothetical protein